MAINVMLDLETMDNISTSAIIEIGACVFSAANGIESEFASMVSLESSLARGLTLSADTLIWWMNQKWDARKRITERKGKVDLFDALNDFSEWIPNGATVWGNGSDFDNVILKNAYRACDLPIPWPKFNDRCFRTMKSIFGSVKPPEREGVHHSALDDAKHQALWLLKIYKEKLV